MGFLVEVLARRTDCGNRSTGAGVAIGGHLVGRQCILAACDVLLPDCKETDWIVRLKRHDDQPPIKDR